MLIQNYGLFWRRDQIEGEVDGMWPRSGKLLGIGVRRKREKPVDFATQRGIYALYDDNFRLIYVGQAGKGKTGLYKRLRSHTITNLSQRWSRFSWFGIRPVSPVEGQGGNRQLVDISEVVETSPAEILNHIEAVLIMAGEPLRNAKGGNFGEGVHYRQAALRLQKGEVDADNSEYFDDEDAA